MSDVQALQETTTAPAEGAARPVFECFEGFALASVLSSLERSGLLAALEQGPVGAARGAGGGHVAAGGGPPCDLGAGGGHVAAGGGPPCDLQLATLRYLAQRELVTERDGAFALTERGAAICREKGYLVWLEGGYGHVLAALGGFIDGSKRYGSDVVREGRWVAEGSALIGRDDVAPHANEVLRSIAFTQVVDLGCGNARFLIGAARRFGVRGVGVDLSPEACEDAARMIADADLSDRVTVRCGDAGALDAIPELAQSDLAVAHFLLHEIFEHGREALVGYLTKLGTLMPAGAHMLVAEVQPASGAPHERWRPEFTLLHEIMRQQLLDADGWHEAFSAAGWSRREVRELGLPGAILLLYRNDKGAS